MSASYARINDRTGYKPDVVWYRQLVQAWTDVPALAVEVLSPSTRRFDERVKVTRYLAAGVEEVWLVDTDAHTVRITRADGATSTLGDTAAVATPLLPDFTLAVSSLWI